MINVLQFDDARFNDGSVLKVHGYGSGAAGVMAEGPDGSAYVSLSAEQTRELRDALTANLEDDPDHAADEVTVKRADLAIVHEQAGKRIEWNVDRSAAWRRLGAALDAVPPQDDTDPLANARWTLDGEDVTDRTHVERNGDYYRVKITDNEPKPWATLTWNKYPEYITRSELVRHLRGVGMSILANRIKGEQ